MAVYPYCLYLRDTCRNGFVGMDFLEGSGYVEHRVDGVVHDPAFRYHLKPGYAVRAFMDEYLVIPVGAPGADDSKMAVLSPVAEFIWSLLQEPRSFEELLEGLTAEFDVAEDVAAADIEEFLKELDSYGFLLKEDGI